MMKMAKQGEGGGVIQYVFGSILLLAVLGMVTNIVTNATSTAGVTDNLGVQTGINTYGPILVTVIFVLLIVVVVGYMLRSLGVFGG